MQPRTEKLWARQNQHQGDRERLFSTVAANLTARRVLYPGSYVDVAPSFVFDDTIYVDSDKRANAFFSDTEGVAQIIAESDSRRSSDRPVTPLFSFIHQDYRDVLAIEEESVDLLISLYAGFVSEACTRYLRVGGSLLVNPSHGDASLASIDDRYSLAAVVKSDRGQYRLDSTDLETYFVPKKPQEITAKLLHQLGRGIAYTRSPFAYLFTRVR